MTRLTRSRSNLSQSSPSQTNEKWEQKKVNLTNQQPNSTVKKKKNSPQVIILVNSSSEEEDELISNSRISTSKQSKLNSSSSSSPTAITTTPRRYPIRNASLKNKLNPAPTTSSNLKRIKKCELSSSSSEEESETSSSATSSDESASFEDIDEEAEEEIEENEENEKTYPFKTNSKFKLDSFSSSLPEQQIHSLKPFRFSNAGKIKFKKNTKNLGSASNFTPSVFPIVPRCSTPFVPLFSGDEPKDLVELRHYLFLQSLEILHSAVETTKALLFQPFLEHLLHFVHEAWNDSMVSTRFIDALPTALFFSHGMDPSALFQQVQFHLDPSLFATLVLTKESIPSFSSLISSTVQLYASTSVTSLEQEKETHTNQSKFFSEVDPDLDSLPRNQSPICICMIPSLESIPTSFFSEYIELIPKGFRMIFIIALSTSTEFMATQLSFKAYQRLYMHVYSLPLVSVSLDLLMQQFFKKSIQTHFYYQLHSNVMEYLMSNATQVHGSFMHFVAQLKYALFDFFFSQPLSFFIHAEHRPSTLPSSSSSLDYLVLIKSLPSVFHFLKSNAKAIEKEPKEKTNASESSSSSWIVSLLTQPSRFFYHLHQWLNHLDLHFKAQSIVLEFLYECQSILNMEPKKAFTELYQLALEDSLDSSGFAQTMLKLLKTLCELCSLTQPPRGSKGGLNPRPLLEERVENEQKLFLDSNFNRLIQVFQLFLQLLLPYESGFSKEVGQTKADLAYLESFLSSFPFHLSPSLEELQLPKKRTSTTLNDAFQTSLSSKKRKLSVSNPQSLSNPSSLSSFASSSSMSLDSSDSFSQDAFSSIYQCVQRLWKTIETWMAPISSFPCHEIYIYRRKHVLEQAFYSNPPQALHHVLSHPEHYLSSPIPPDITLLHRLYTEASKTISIADFFEAFKVLLPSSSSTPTTSSSSPSSSLSLSSRSRSKQQTKTTSDSDTDTSLMIRFLRGMGELEYLGLIQKKKKGSHFHHRSTHASSETVAQSVLKVAWG